MKIKTGILLLLLVVSMAFWGSDVTVWAASGNTTVAVSGKTIDIGNTVKVTVKAAGPSGEKTVATMTVSYDAGVLQFVDCSTTYGGGGGSVTATSDSFTVTLKAVAAGTSKISVSGSDGVIFDTNEELESMAGSSTSITVNNAAAQTAAPATETKIQNNTADANTTAASEEPEKKLSADNSLKVLTISPGTLSPEFSGPVTKYTAVVSNDVTSIAVTATPVNEKAVVESVTGNENLSVGNNTIQIVVKAENGVTATYTIAVTREQAGEAGNQNEPEEAAGSQEGATEQNTELQNETEPEGMTETEPSAATETMAEAAQDEATEEIEDMDSDMQYLQEQYTALLNKYNKTKSVMMRGIIGLAFVIVILIMALINVATRVFSPKDTDDTAKRTAIKERPGKAFPPKEDTKTHINTSAERERKEIKERESAEGMAKPAAAAQPVEKEEKKTVRKAHFSDNLEDDLEASQAVAWKKTYSAVKKHPAEQAADEPVTERTEDRKIENHKEPDNLEDDLEVLDLNDL